MRSQSLKPLSRYLSAVALFLSLSGSALSGDTKVSIADLSAKHLDSLGTHEARVAIKSRVAKGTVAFNERISGSVHLDGSALLLTQGAKQKCAFQFNNPQYRGEQLVFDGKNVQVALIDQQSRSALGNFLVNEPEILQEGLLGGTLSMGWPLLDTGTTKAKLKSDGLKKIDGRQLYELEYIPQKRSSNGELSIHLYFDPDTFRHVRTVYRLQAVPLDQGDSQATDSGMKTTTVEERFDDFHAVDGITLPNQWEIRLRVEPGKAQEFQWKIAFSSIVHNSL